MCRENLAINEHCSRVAGEVYSRMACSCPPGSFMDLVLVVGGGLAEANWRWTLLYRYASIHSCTRIHIFIALCWAHPPACLPVVQSSLTSLLCDRTRNSSRVAPFVRFAIVCYVSLFFLLPTSIPPPRLPAGCGVLALPTSCGWPSCLRLIPPSLEVNSQTLP